MAAWCIMEDRLSHQGMPPERKNDNPDVVAGPCFNFLLGSRKLIKLETNLQIQEKKLQSVENMNKIRKQTNVLCVHVRTGLTWNILNLS